MTIGVYKRTSSTFHLRNRNEPGDADIVVQLPLDGDNSKAVPITGDWDGNGSMSIGVWRSGTFYLRNSNTPGPGEIVTTFGLPSHTPLAGNWDGK